MVPGHLRPGRLVQSQIIVKFVRGILYWLLNTGGSLFQVVVWAGLAVSGNSFRALSFYSPIPHPQQKAINNI